MHIIATTTVKWDTNLNRNNTRGYNSPPPETMAVSEKENDIWHIDSSLSFAVNSCLSIGVFSLFLSPTPGVRIAYVTVVFTSGR